jgi:hypothetical protein
MEETLRGVEALAERGCFPILSPFRPDPGTPLRNHLPPNANSLEETFLRSLDIAEYRGVKLGPRCIPCTHNTLTLPDGSQLYYRSSEFKNGTQAA